DLPGDDLVERGPGDEVLGLGALRRAAGQIRAGAHRMRALQRTIQIRHDDDRIAEGLNRLEDGTELEVDACRRRRPMAPAAPPRDEKSRQIVRVGPTPFFL